MRRGEKLLTKINQRSNFWQLRWNEKLMRIFDSFQHNESNPVASVFHGDKNRRPLFCAIGLLSLSLLGPSMHDSHVKVTYEKLPFDRKASIWIRLNFSIWIWSTRGHVSPCMLNMFEAPSTVGRASFSAEKMHVKWLSSIASSSLGVYVPRRMAFFACGKCHFLRHFVTQMSMLHRIYAMELHFFKLQRRFIELAAQKIIGNSNCGGIGSGIS